MEVTQPWIFLSINSLTNILNKKERDQVVSKWTLNLTALLLLIEETISNALWVKPAFISFMLICAILRILLSCIKRKMFWWNVHIYSGFIKVVFRQLGGGLLSRCWLFRDEVDLWKGFKSNFSMWVMDALWPCGPFFDPLWLETRSEVERVMTFCPGSCDANYWGFL